jgi:hypothetical protein
MNNLGIPFTNRSKAFTLLAQCNFMRMVGDTDISFFFFVTRFAFETIFLYLTMRIGNYNIWKKLDAKLYQDQRETQRRLLEVERTMENVHCL